MDLVQIKEGTLRLREEMLASGYRFDGAILFGSHAKGTQSSQSDVDLAIISKDFGKNALLEGAMMMKLAFRVFPESEIVPLSLYEYLDPRSVSPILHEIKTTGIELF